ncbi:hypothetical protein [Streptosporangium roseum]|uniref:Uncharacterized protein n=1 Tax=Streptosporangium roseum (strain ATCC 12428 / DSM 43021 / JCM 3005 / KCTC 9067 / NCIMB 10171 / NRRL 2505 / NI 9100) TaxID=479432 RepID=D2AUH4_STRRD|nr:hypothetical protein [Streptosporangium roseum]ACZ84836.1 hypothetical protein Sros_1848 [Streptosporangium roseum DSM 43021]
MPHQPLSAAGRADALAAAVGLITARRAGLPSGELGRQVLAAMTDLQARHPGQAAQTLAWLIGQLAAQAAHACDEWDKAAGGTPAAEWLTNVGAHAAQRRE